MSIYLETRITGPRRIRLLQELFGNTAHFPIAIILLELLLEGPSEYLRSPDLYSLIFTTVVQAYWLTRWQETSNPRRFIGNLLGPALYTIVEVSMEGLGFFSGIHHIVYWGFAVAIGLLQEIRTHLPKGARLAIILMENIIRSSILLVMYYVFEIATANQPGYTVGMFFADSSHIFVTIAIILIGASSGLAGATTEHYLELLRETSAQLKEYSEWLLGRDLLAQVIKNPEALAMKEISRTVLFMDIRGFTKWSEAQEPEKVAQMLTEYYQRSERVLSDHTVKLKFSADEVMAVFLSPIEKSIAVVFDLRDSINQTLGKYELGAGIGIHTGPVVEGLLGSKAVKFYDVIGDTVNTAKRLESQAGFGEILVSSAVREQLGEEISVGEERLLQVKGKEKELTVYSIQRLRTG